MSQFQVGDLVAHKTNETWPWYVTAVADTAFNPALQPGVTASTVTDHGRVSGTFHPDELVPYRVAQDADGALQVAKEKAVEAQMFDLSADVRALQARYFPRGDK